MSSARSVAIAGQSVGQLTVFLAGLLIGNSVALGAGVLSASPTGAVKSVQQFLVKYSTDMVPMGDPRVKDPMTVACAGNKAPDAAAPKIDIPAGKGRWVDSKTWSYDFDKPLSSGIRCTFTQTASKDLASAAVPAGAPYVFTTGGPAIVQLEPRYGDIEPGQYFVIETDGAMDLKSIEEHAFFESNKSIVSRIGAKIITGPDREKVIRTVVETNWPWASYRPLLKGNQPFASMKEFSRFVVLTGKSRFPESSKVAFHWTKEIQSESKIPVAEPQKYEFNVMAPFEATFNCERVNPDRPCNPILDARVQFNSQVDRKSLQLVKLIGPKNQIWLPYELSPEAKKRGNTEESSLGYLTFKAPFPEKTEFKLVLPAGLKDELGRSLVNQAKFPLAVKTDEFSPLVKFAAPFGILERNAEPLLPVSVRNVEKILASKKHSMPAKSMVLNSTATPAEIIQFYRDVKTKDYGYGEGRVSRSQPLIDGKKGVAFQIPKPGGERDFELIGIPLKEPGFHVVEIQSPKLGVALLDGPPMYVASAALVTNLSVHLKKGRESSVVWVTTLDRAQVVPGAEISITDGEGKLLSTGKTDGQGIYRAPVDYPCDWDEAERWGHSCEIFAFAKLADDVSFVSSQWKKGIEEYRYNLQSEYLQAPWGPLSAHAVLDRAVIQTGETLHFKIFLRDRVSNGFAMYPAARTAKRILIRHNGSGKVYSLPFQFDAKTSSAIGEFQIPKGANLGFYDISLSSTDRKKADSDEGGDYEYLYGGVSVGNFVVEEYRLPLMESTVKVQGADLVRPKAIDVDLSANFLSGGPAVDLPVVVRSAIVQDSFSPEFPGSTEYSFFSRPVKIGARGEQAEEAEVDLAFVSNQKAKLGPTGGTKLTISGLPDVSTVRAVMVEMEYRDPNGEVKTGRGQVRIFPSETVVGLKSESWLAKAGKVSVGGILITPQGRPVPGADWVVEAYRQEYISHRKRIVGGFYSYDSSQKTTSLGVVCKGQSNAKGEFTCNAEKLPAGSVILQARAIDKGGRPTYASVGMSVYEDGDFSWWTPSDSDRVDLIPERTSYKPEETARFVLRSPFPQSKVLVTVEREGILDAFVTELKRENPVIDVPLKGNFAPNVYVSALAVRGRVGEPKPTALLDLGRPAIKMGVSKIKVGWSAHELKVSVTPQKKRYRTREKVTTKIKVVRADGKPVVDGEIAVAVVDEALSLLRKNWSVELLTAMMGERPWAVSTASSQNQVIGKRHFGSKARPPGGGGGAGLENRELFDPLLAWIPRIKLDANGEATVDFALNDSMTSFRIHVVANAGAQHFGSSSSVIQSTKDLILYSGFAPVVRDGDKIQNAVTIRNTTEKAMKVEVIVASSTVAGLPKIPSVELKPSESRTVFIATQVPSSTKEIEYEVSAKDTIGNFTDRLKVKSIVQEAVPARVLQATLLQIDKPYSIPLQQPKDAIKDRGGISVDAQSTLLSSLLGVKSYMEEYPYTCLEQKFSKGVVAEDKTAVKKVIDDLPTYLDGNGLLKFFPSSTCGSPQLSRYVLTLAKASGLEIPKSTLDQVLGGLEKWMSGNAQCKDWWEQYASTAYRDQARILVIDAMSQWGRFQPITLNSISIAPNLWTTVAVTALAGLADRESEFPNREALLKQVDLILRARVNYQGTLVNLQKPLDGEAQWILFSSADQEAQALFNWVLGAKGWTDDVGRMARGIQARQKKGIWDSTMANAWGVTNLRLFTAKFEKEKVLGQTVFDAPGKNPSVNWKVDWAESPAGDRAILKWPEGSHGSSVKLGIQHTGQGKPWVLLQTKSAISLKAPLDLGYQVSRKVSKVLSTGELQTKGPVVWKNGDVAEVEIKVIAKYDHPWVVIRDPIPAGASHLGSSLDGTSVILNRTGKGRPKPGEISLWPFEFEEKSMSHFTSYAGYVLKGTYGTTYRIRLNSSGTFKLPPSRVEAMYSPENFGEVPIADWSIAP